MNHLKQSALALSVCAVLVTAQAATPPAPAKYSDAQIKSLVAKMKQLKPDMTTQQVVSLLGQPERQQPVSSKQIILVYPLSIIVSMVQNSRTGQWQVATPALYTNPACRREDGAPQRGALGEEVVELPGTNCIPARFMAGPKSALQQAKIDWKVVKDGTSTKEFIDPASIRQQGEVKEVRTLSSYNWLRNSAVFGYEYRSQIQTMLVSCDAQKIQAGKNVASASDESYLGEMASGAVTYRQKNSNPAYLYWTDNPELTAAICG